MKKRQKRLKRVFDLQRKLKQLEEWKLGRLEVQKNEILQNKMELVSALNQTSGSGLLFSDLITQSLSAASKRGHHVDRKRQFQKQLLQTLQQQLKHIERIYELNSREYSSREVQMELEAVLEHEVTKL